MRLHFKSIVYIVIFAFCSENHNYADELSFNQIHELRSQKVKKNRKFYGKKFLIKKLGEYSDSLANIIADTSSRLGCDFILQKNISKTLGKKRRKKSTLISFACKAKQREK